MLLIIIIEEEKNSYELIDNSFVRHCVFCDMGESTTTRWKSNQIVAIVYVQCDTLQNRWYHIRIPIHSACHRNDQRWKTSRQDWSIGCLYHWQNHLLYVLILAELRFWYAYFDTVILWFISFLLSFAIVARRKTIYEYHRVNFNGQDIQNDTLIMLKALPTCLEFKDCASCLDAKMVAFNVIMNLELYFLFCFNTKALTLTFTMLMSLIFWFRFSVHGVHR